jgi:succinate-semialdehyde dehydrogenase/glutarate-semialdehyde dehydrogenase
VSELVRLNLKRADLYRQSAYIDGRWVTGETTISVLNPATGRELGVAPALGRAETLTAVAAAERALPAWRALTAKARGEILRKWFELMMTHQEDLARLLTAEQGKPLAEARGEIAYAASFLEWFAEEGRRAYGEIIPPHQSDRRLHVIRQPVGVVAAITPWNFPSAMITRKVAPALAAGCTVVLKPADLTPFSALALAVLAQEAGVPPGVFNIVTGPPKEIGEVLTEDPRIAKFTFTGSTAVGKMLAARCMGTVKRVSLELGGNAPFIVFEDADIDAAVEGAMISKFRNSGQTCVCANRFLVHRRVHEAFAHKLAERAEALVVGDGLAGPTDQGPLINTAAVAKVARHVEALLGDGAKLLTGGLPHELGGTYYQPTVMTGLKADNLLNREETFGPLAGLIAFEDPSDAIRIANDTRSGLAAYMYTRDLSRATHASEALDYGMVGVNTGVISNEIGPFGGVKESGLGREGSRHGIDEYLNLKMSVFAV